MNLENLDRYIHTGIHDRYWYEECERLFVELFGRERLPLVTKLFAATSINSSLPSNIRLFRKALHQIEHGLPLIGYLPVIQRQLELVKAGLPLSGRKINAFANAMSGDRDAVVVDIWLLRCFGMDVQSIRNTGPHAGKMRSRGATKKEFETITTFVREEAVNRNFDPRQLSAILWSGTRIAMGGNRETGYGNILRHQTYNMYEQKTITENSYCKF